ncbi:MAG: CidA/LrgA family protein [Pseudomonadota bacterium]
MVFFLTLILVCQLAGESLVAATGLPLPGPVVGMAILFAGLCLRGLPADLGRVADGLLGNLSLLFVPAGVGVMVHAGLLGREWLPLLAALVVSTIATVAVTGVLMARLGERAKDAGDGR